MYNLYKGNMSAVHLLFFYDTSGRASVYREMLRSPSDAVALARVEDAPDWFVYSGSPDVLKSFVQYVGSAKQPTRNTIVAAATTVFHGIVHLSVQASDFHASAAPQTRPGVGIYPKNINSQGRALWDRLMGSQRIADNLAGQQDRAAWAIAVQLYFNRATHSNIVPFAEDTRVSHLPQHQNEQPLKQTGIQEGYLIRSFVQQLHKNLKMYNFVSSSSSDWFIRDVIYANNKYNIAISKTVPINHSVQDPLTTIKRYLIAREGFSPYPRMQNTLVYRLSGTGYMLVALAENPLHLQFITILAFTRPFLESALGLKRNALNKDALLKKLREYTQEHLLSDANYHV
jgi:hypothetical protein